jgi:hypothetical protein
LTPFPSSMALKICGLFPPELPFRAWKKC